MKGNKMLRLIIGGSASGKSEYAERLVCSLPGKRIYVATMEPFGEEGRERIARHRKLREGKGFVTAEVPRDLGAFTDALRMGRAQGEVFGKVPDTEAAWENLDTEAAWENLDTEAAWENPGTEADREESGTETVREETDTETAREEPKTESVRRTHNILLEDLPNLVANELFADGEFPVTDAERLDVIFNKVIRAIEELSCISEELTIVTGDIFSDGVRYDSSTEEYRRLLAKVNCRIAENTDQVVFVTAGCPVAADTGNTNSSPAGETDPECEDTFFCVKDTGKETAAVDLRQKPSHSEKHSERKSGMVFVTGPLASGKRTWVQKNLAISGGNIVRAAELFRERPAEGVFQEDSTWEVQNQEAAVQEESAQESRNSEIAARKESVWESRNSEIAARKESVWESRNTEEAAREDDVQESQYPGFAHPERMCVTDVQELVGKNSMTAEELEALADKLAAFRVVISCEVGGGVIPLDRGERIWRENAGRLACLLADRADRVILVHCGIGICIKPA